MNIKLTKPIDAHGEQITALTLREPVAEDVMVCGYPLTIGDAEATPNAAAIGKLIARLGGIPPSSVKAMHMADFNKAMGVILSFFGE